MFNILLEDFSVVYLLIWFKHKSHDDSNKRLQK